MVRRALARREKDIAIDSSAVPGTLHFVYVPSMSLSLEVPVLIARIVLSCGKGSPPTQRGTNDSHRDRVCVPGGLCSHRGLQPPSTTNSAVRHARQVAILESVLTVIYLA